MKYNGKYTNIIYSLTVLALILTNKGYSQFNTIKKPISSIMVIKEKEKDTLIYIKDSVQKKLLYLPLDSIHVTSHYGMRYHPIRNTYIAHNGIDLRGKNADVYSITNAIVKEVDYNRGSGLYIKLQSGEYEFIYAHLSHIYVKENQLLLPGQIIGRSGNSGLSTAKHLHFAIKKKKLYINPISYLALIESI